MPVCCRCRFWFYGDDPVEERLARLGSYLDTYDARTDIESLVPKQPLFSEPRKVVGYYAAGNAEVRAARAAANACFPCISPVDGVSP